MTASPSPEPRPEPGWVIWITGLAGSGKSTIGHALWRRLRERTPGVLLLDADKVRAAMANDLGYTMEDRLANARRLSRLADLLSRQGLHVIVPTISLFHECHRWNRENLQRYLEVLLDVDEETLRTRNQRGLRSPGVSNVMGVDQRPEYPEAPDLVLHNGLNAESIPKTVERILARLSGV